MIKVYVITSEFLELLVALIIILYDFVGAFVANIIKDIMVIIMLIVNKPIILFANEAKFSFKIKFIGTMNINSEIIFINCETNNDINDFLTFLLNKK